MYNKLCEYNENYTKTSYSSFRKNIKRKGNKYEEK